MFVPSCKAAVLSDATSDKIGIRQCRGWFLSISFFILLLAGVSSPSSAQSTEPTRILFIFDASFSMYGEWQSGTKIEVAKKLFAEFLDTLKSNNPNLEIALRCFGHQTPLRPNIDCKDTKLEVPFGPVRKNVPLIKKRMETILPTGTTPIAYSLGEAANDFPTAYGRNIIVLITDGVEECDGDPCAISLKLQEKGVILKPFVLGIGLGTMFADLMGCVGKFYDITSEASFKGILNMVVSEAINRTTIQVNLLDINKKPTETDVDMTFYDESSGEIRYNFLHTINNRGNPDTLSVNPSARYKLVVHTIPPVEKSGIVLKEGQHNVIVLDAPQGSLALKTEGPNTYKSLQALIRRKGEKASLHVQDFSRVENYLVGKYDIEILCLPRIIKNDLDISQSKTTTITIPQAGILTLMKPGEGAGSVYLEDGKKIVWVCNMKDLQTQENIVLQPGNYRAEFRSKILKKSDNTIERRFKIESGISTTVKLY
jgi:Ca-activated chloride channel family protein